MLFLPPPHYGYASRFQHLFLVLRTDDALSSVGLPGETYVLRAAYILIASQLDDWLILPLRKANMD